MPNDIRSTDHTGLRVMGVDECLARLGQTPVGRLAFELDGEIAVLPVTHLLDGVDVCFRTAGDSKIQAAVDRDRVSYEVDGFDAHSRTGWSVLVHGTALVVADDDEIRKLNASSSRPWVPDVGLTWIRVRSQAITGRELAAVADTR
jgi:nitroimidazol reductase NimA-like FMN-containing flavoprotein (pyridoxamine 5'-phosphate oxidase superfamily)